MADRTNRPKRGKGLTRRTKKKSSISPTDLKTKAVKVSEDPSQTQLCAYCHRPRDTSELEAGEFFQIGPIYVHYFCVLFSSQCRQRGTDEQGLFGCFLSDIQAELKRGSKLTCHFCDQTCATVTCSFKGCGLNFHYTCGRADGCIFVFKGNMEGFCPKHGPRDREPPTINDLICLAGCSEKINSKQRCITSPCCGRRYHYHCLQSMAMASGLAHFKCPICSEKNAFTQKCVQYGVYIPNRDAAWEQPSYENFYQFAAMGQSRRHCDAPKCLCGVGRSFHKPNSNFQIVPCSYCGSRAVHIKCGRLDPDNIRYICESHGDESTTIQIPLNEDLEEASDPESSDATQDSDSVDETEETSQKEVPPLVNLSSSSDAASSSSSEEAEEDPKAVQSKKRLLAFAEFKARMEKKIRADPESDEEITVLDSARQSPPRRIQLRDGQTLAYIKIRDVSNEKLRRSPRKPPKKRESSGSRKAEPIPILVLGSSDEDEA